MLDGVEVRWRGIYVGIGVVSGGKTVARCTFEFGQGREEIYDSDDLDWLLG